MRHETHLQTFQENSYNTSTVASLLMVFCQFPLGALRMYIMVGLPQIFSLMKNRPCTSVIYPALHLLSSYSD